MSDPICPPPSFRLEINSLQDFQTFVRIIRGEDPEISAELDRLEAERVKLATAEATQPSS